jgi:hypothetical protein
MLRAIFMTMRRLLSDRRVRPTCDVSLRANDGTSRAVGHKVASAIGPTERSAKVNDAYEKLIQHFDAHEIRYLTSGDNQTVWADFRGVVGSYRVVATVDAADGVFQVFGYSPVYVPEGSKPAIAETLARANCGLKVGKFEMNYDQGEVRFQAAHILADNSLEDETIRRLMGTTMSMLNVYLPAVLSVIYGNELPKDAVACVEGRRGGMDESECDQRRADE